MTQLAIVVSRADDASVHIGEHLRELADWTEQADETRPPAAGGGTYYRLPDVELRSFEDLHLELERPTEAFDSDPDLLVFASRHAGETGPLLTGHFTGNVGPAEYGGEDGALAEAAPNALPHLLAAFDEHAPAGYDVGLECTHHGPSDVGCPSLFAELGSEEPQWSDPAGAEAVARAILALRGVEPHRERTVVGFGGGHYVPRFERIVRETPWAVGHVAADWGLEAMGDPAAHGDLLERAFAASGADVAVVEGDREAVAEAITDRGYRVVSESWLRAVGDRPLAVVEAVETELGPIADGVQFGAVSGEHFEVAALPSELATTAEGIDPAAAWDAVAEHCLALETANGGSRLGERVAIPAAEPRAALEAIVDGLATVLEQRYEEVRVDADVVTAREQAFDPTLAAERGVPEGPAFGQLANGEAVTVDGDRIDPDSVHVDHEHQFPVPIATRENDS